MDERRKQAELRLRLAYREHQRAQARAWSAGKPPAMWRPTRQQWRG